MNVFVASQIVCCLVVIMFHKAQFSVEPPVDSWMLLFSSI